MNKMSKIKSTERKILLKSPKKQDPLAEKALEQVNQEISEKPLPDPDKNSIDPFLLRIDKLDKLDLESVQEEQREESPLKVEDKKEDLKSVKENPSANKGTPVQ
jgi:hypothetical protein